MLSKYAINGIPLDLLLIVGFVFYRPAMYNDRSEA